MKTKIAQFKFGIAGLVILILSACTVNVTGSAVFGNQPLERDYTFQKSKILNTEENGLLPIGVLPIFIGTIEANLNN